ncbi:DNA helicase mcm9, partial [Kickxella alabastrina]
GDLVDKAKSGDSVTVTGTVLLRWRATTVGERPDVALALRASSVLVHSSDQHSSAATLQDDNGAEFRHFWASHALAPMRGRDHIVAAMCPGVYGLYYVKLAVLLVLLGGVMREDAQGMRVRGDMHLLLVGDPGTAKSQFLKFAARLVPRSVLTTGVGSTAAGLTVTAVRDGAEWQLEAGALVLADRGICCIDEFGSVRQAEKATILEAMEQQSISVAKAGIVCKLNARCSVLAAMNPRGKYDPYQDLTVNTALSSPLLSRFDLIMVLLDTQDDEWDARIADFLLGGPTNGTSGTSATNAARAANAANAANGTNDGADDTGVWGFDRLQAYVALVKTRIHPTATGPSEQVLTRYYQLQRQRDSANTARTTIRLLESLIRLAQAHARLMFRSTLRVCDAVMAVVLMESTMLSASVLAPTDALHSPFPEDPDAAYALLEKQVLAQLNLDGLAD